MPDPWRQDRGEPGRRAAGETRREDHGLASRPPAGVVAMAMGGPARPEEVRPFLRALFADPDLIQAPLGPLRRPFAHLMATLREKGARRRYGLVGGSPLVEETRLQVAALESELLKDGLPVELALAYGFPGPSDALASLRARGVRLVLGLPMYPQWSRATSGASLRALERALHGLQPSPGNDVAPMSLREVGPFPSLPGFIGPLAAQAREAMDRARSRGLHAAVLLTAHGLPERYVQQGDPYVTQVEESAAAFREAAGLAEPVRLGYQSRLGPLRWVGPQVEEVVNELASRGTRALVVVPLTFLCEHLETRYDLDLSLRSHAWTRGILDYQRLPAPGARPELIKGLAALVRAAR